VAVALPALAMRWLGELPSGVVDYAAEVRSHGDFFMPHVDPEAGRRAVQGAAGGAYSHADLLQGFAAPAKGPAAESAEGGERLLVRAAEGLESVLAQSLGAWQRDGSVVLVHPDVAVTDRLLSDERVSRS
jgi:uncharacterized protein (TIGR03089 family)